MLKQRKIKYFLLFLSLSMVMSILLLSINGQVHENKSLPQIMYDLLNSKQALTMIFYSRLTYVVDVSIDSLTYVMN
jgi:hypothetical protein